MARFGGGQGPPGADESNLPKTDGCANGQGHLSLRYVYVPEPEEPGHPCNAFSMRSLAVAAAVLLAAGCGASGAAPPAGAPPLRPSASAPPAPPSAAPALTPADLVPAPHWKIGASALPLRPDGFGQVLPTPRVLRDRRLPTRDLLPPPIGTAFRATVGPVTPDLRERMGETWSPRCPVTLRQLRYLTLPFHGFDGKTHTGELVVAARVADDVVEVFRQLYAARFPIEEMRLPTTADLRAKPTGDGNNTAGYVCRAARGQSRFSAHAYGFSVDINPFHNPQLKGDLVVPELASAYGDRTWTRPGMLFADSVAVRAFNRIGWTWGGTWRSQKDPMHFSLTGD